MGLAIRAGVTYTVGNCSLLGDMLKWWRLHRGTGEGRRQQMEMGLGGREASTRSTGNLAVLCLRRAASNTAKSVLIGMYFLVCCTLL